MADKPNSGGFACAKCSFESIDIESFQTHLDSSHPRDNSHWCKWCGTLYTERQPLVEHLINKECRNTYHHPCGFEGCGFTEEDPTRFIFHLRNIHRGKPLIPCKYCRRLFTIPVCLIAHIQTECCNRPTPNVYTKPVSYMPKIPLTSAVKSNTIARPPPPAVVGSSNNKVIPPTSSFPGAPPLPVVAKTVPTNPSKTVQSNVSSNQEQSVTSSTNKAAKINRQVESDRREPYRNPFNADGDSDPDDPSWKPSEISNSRTNKRPLRSTHRPNSYSESTSTISHGSANDSSRKRKPSEIVSTDSSKIAKPTIEIDLEPPPNNICDWNLWRETIMKGKSVSNMMSLLSPSNICNFFKCIAGNCGFSSDNAHEFCDHIVKNHSHERSKCFYCFESTADPESFIKHIFTQHGKRKYQCSVCLFRACSKNHVKMHQKGMHDDEDASILVCRAPLGSVQYPLIKKEVEEPRVCKSYDCCVSGCDFNTPITTEFQEHCIAEHGSTIIFSCCYCKFKTATLSSYMVHFQTHDMHEYECAYCSFGAEKSDDVLQHLCMNHADDKLQMSSRLAPTQEDCTNERSEVDTKTTDPEANKLTFPLKISPRNEPVSDQITSLTGAGISHSKKAEMPHLTPVRSGASENVKPSPSKVLETFEHPKRSSTPNKSSELKFINLDTLNSSDDAILAKINNCNKSNVSSEDGDSDFNNDSFVDIENDSSDEENKESPAEEKSSTKIVLSVDSDSDLESASSSKHSRTSKNKGLKRKLDEEPKSYICKVCGKSYVAYTGILYHGKELHNIIGQYRCSLCDYQSKMSKDVILHASAVHPKDHVEVRHNLYHLKNQDCFKTIYPIFSKRSTDQEVNYLCVFCNHSTLDSLHMIEHLYKELEYYPYHCKYCTYKSHRTSIMFQHCADKHSHQPLVMDSKIDPVVEKWVSKYLWSQKCKHDGEGILAPTKLCPQPSEKNCKMCGLKLDLADLRNHMLEHIHYNPHQCLLCNESFRTLTQSEKHLVQAHGKINSKEWSYKKIPFLENWAQKVIMKTFSFPDKSCDSTSVTPKLTARKSTKSLSSLLPSEQLDQKKPSVSQAHFKTTARKSTSKPPRILQVPRKVEPPPCEVQPTPLPISTFGFSNYGTAPSPVNLNDIFIMTKPPGYNTSVRLNAIYLKDMFRKDIKVVISDCRRSFLLSQFNPFAMQEPNA